MKLYALSVVRKDSKSTTLVSAYDLQSFGYFQRSRQVLTWLPYIRNTHSIEYSKLIFFRLTATIRSYELQFICLLCNFYVYWIEQCDLILKSTESQLIEIYKGIKSKIHLCQCVVLYVVIQHLKYLHVKITNLLRVVV